MTQHTPTPWRTLAKSPTHIECGDGLLAQVYAFSADGTEFPSEANAALIVRAVNAHEALVEFAEYVDKVNGSTEGAEAMVREFKYRAQRVLALAREATQ